jgi:class 3 adenylate cyclase
MLQELAQGTVTILFTDIEDSVALTERLGDRRWLEVLREHNALVREQVRAHAGFEVKAQGDGFMLAFRSARHGLECAIGIQRSFDRRKQPADASLRVRIGLHTGEVVREADDFYGRHVNLASRIADLAQAGETLVSALLKELAEGSGEFAFDEGRDVNLKGLSGEQRVFTLVWDKGRES